MQRTSGPTVRLRKAAFRRHARRLGLTSDAQVARHLGVSQATILRLFRDDSGPGESLIAAALTAFPGVAFEDIFVVVKRSRSRAA